MNNKLSLVFFGSSKYSTIDEKALHEAYGLSLIVTLPDRLNAKTKQLIPNPVKKFATDNNIPVITTEKLTPEVIENIASFQPDFLVVADFGLILPQSLLDLPKKAAINVHHSLLPKYRGPAPVPFAILAGETTVGVTIILMTDKVDAGDMLAQEMYQLLPTDTTDSVLTRLNELGSGLAVAVIKDFDNLYSKRTPQDESQATFTHYMSRQDGFIDTNHPADAEQINRMIRAYYPWPGVWTRLPKTEHDDGGQAKVTIPKQLQGKILKLLPNNMFQVEGKKPVSKKDLINGYPELKEVIEKIS